MDKKSYKKSHLWLTPSDVIHPLAWELHLSFCEPVCMYCLFLTIYHGDPDRVHGLNWVLPHHCGFFWPALHSVCDSTVSGRPVSVAVLFSPLAPASLVKGMFCSSLDSGREGSILKVSPFLLTYSFTTPMIFSDAGNVSHTLLTSVSLVFSTFL